MKSNPSLPSVNVTVTFTGVPALLFFSGHSWLPKPRSSFACENADFTPQKRSKQPLNA
jgi:hypothetical protein